MSLKRNNLLFKDLDFENGSEMEKIYQEYTSAELPGRFSKNSLDYLLKIYKGCCGEGTGINKVYDALAQYIRVNIANEDSTFADEAAKLQDLYLSAAGYSKDLEQLDQKLNDAIDSWCGSIQSNQLNEKQRAEDMKFVAQSTLLFNRRSFVHTMNVYANSLMYGCLEYEDAAETNSGGLNAFDLPLFTHIPAAEDISKNAFSESKLMQILYNIANKDPYSVMQMMHDCNNGKAIVRLWKKENGIDKPYLFVIPKRDIYIEKIAYKKEKSLWPGLIETAVRSLECQAEEIPYAVLGPELSNYNIEALLGQNISDANEVNQGYNDMVKEYVMCYYDAYSAFFGTQSVVRKATTEHTRLTIAIWEVIYALVCCLDGSIDAADPAIEFLESAIAEYKKSVQENSMSDPAARRGITICDTLETLNKLEKNESEYKDKPRRYFEENLAAKIAKVILKSMREEETPQSLEEKTEAVLNSKTFKSRASKINIHVMNTASEEYAAALLEKMKDL